MMETLPVVDTEGKPDTVLEVEEDEKDPSLRRNTFAAKKTVAQGMMDIALITANANQLRFVMEFNSEEKMYGLTVGLIILSLLLQIGVGVFLVFKGRYDLKGKEKLEHAHFMNNFVVVGVLLITVVNVFIGSFSGTTAKNSTAFPSSTTRNEFFNISANASEEIMYGNNE